MHPKDFRHRCVFEHDGLLCICHSGMVGGQGIHHCKRNHDQDQPHPESHRIPPEGYTIAQNRPHRIDWRLYVRSYFLKLAVLALLVVLTGCQDRRPKTPTNSQSPSDLNGVWIGPEKTLEPPAPMTARGQEFFDAAKPLFGPRSVPVGDSNDPVNICDPQGFPRIIFLRSPLSGMEFVQTPDRVIQFFQYQRVHREIWTDGRSLPADVGGANPQSPDPRWYGYSIGRWTNDGIFVVETVGAMETWADEEGHPHGLGARIEERYRLVDHNTLGLVVNVDDPEMYQKPFVASKQLFKRGKELSEQLCVPSAALQYLELIAKPAAAPK